MRQMPKMRIMNKKQILHIGEILHRKMLEVLYAFGVAQERHSS